MSNANVTLCLTIGRRPDLLRQTLESLAGLPEMPVLAINDFGDEETNEVFRALCPHGRLIDAGGHVGHHPAVDLMYAEVKTPYIFHCEDDWGFTRTDFVEEALAILAHDPKLSLVCMRASNDIPMSDQARATITVHDAGGIAYQRLDQVHDQWHGFSFNPHIAPKKLWEDLGGFSQFKKERYISRHLRAQGRHIAFLLPEACRHIGEGVSTAPRPDSMFKRFKRWMRGIKRVE